MIITEVQTNLYFQIRIIFSCRHNLIKVAYVIKCDPQQSLSSIFLKTAISPVEVMDFFHVDDARTMYCT